MSYEGVLPVFKPADWTSHDVVGKVRRLIGVKRIGHTGTLDPKVTGVLPLCIGRATRVVEYIQELPKTYEAVLTVGYATDTEDDTGAVIARADRVELLPQRVETVLRSFVGEIEQVPPMYSAVRVEGRRLYELAREGKEVERKARKVEIYSLELLDQDLHRDHPRICFRVSCSKGTYIRTLCADIGRALGFPAVMSELARTSTGPFTLEDCVTLADIETLQREGRLASRLVPADRALAHLPAVTLPQEAAAWALQGRSVLFSGASAAEPGQASAAEAAPRANGLCRVYGPDGGFIGLFRLDETHTLFPEKVFN